MKICKLLHRRLEHAYRYKVEISIVSESVETANQEDSKQTSSKCRHVVAVIGFGVFFLLNVFRMNMTVSIVAMVNSSSLIQNANASSTSCPLPAYENNTDRTGEYSIEKENGEFDWSPKIQGYILGGGFIGYFLTQFVAGKLSEIFGCKWVIFWGLFVSSVTTLVTPFVSWWNVNVLIFVQTLRGMAQGFFQPSMSVLIANWFPDVERGSVFAFMMSGNGAGALTGGLVSGYLCDSSFGRWPSVFYICGAAGIIVSLLTAALLCENPAVHPSISERERKFIISNQESKQSCARPSTPWLSIFTSVPIYALAFAFFGQNWAGTHFLAVHPTFLGTILHIPIAQNGLFTSVPFLLQTVFTLIASWISNILSKKNYAGVDKVRKFWNFLSCLGYSGCLLGVYFAECNTTMSISFSFLSMACIGFAYAGCMIVPADMTPTFAGSVTGIVSTFGTTAGFILSLVVGFLTDGKQTLEQWNKILFMSIGVVMSSGVLFCIFGSADIQRWNNVAAESRENEESKNKRY